MLRSDAFACARCAESLQKSLRLDGVVGPSARRRAASARSSTRSELAKAVAGASGCELCCFGRCLATAMINRVAPARVARALAPSAFWQLTKSRLAFCKTLASLGQAVRARAHPVARAFESTRALRLASRVRSLVSLSSSIGSALSQRSAICSPAAGYQLRAAGLTNWLCLVG